MKLARYFAPGNILGLFIIAGAVVAGCSPPAVSPATSPLALQNANGTHGTHPLTLVTTRVKFYNSGSSTIVGMGSAACWSISPTPLPSVPPGDYSTVETLTYDTSCGTPNFLDISYGVAGAEATDCTFATKYVSSFSYSVTNSELTACTATPSTNATYDELFTYAASGSLYKRHSYPAVTRR